MPRHSSSSSYIRVASATTTLSAMRMVIISWKAFNIHLSYAFWKWNASKLLYERREIITKTIKHAYTAFLSFGIRGLIETHIFLSLGTYQENYWWIEKRVNEVFFSAASSSSSFGSPSHGLACVFSTFVRLPVFLAFVFSSVIRWWRSFNSMSRISSTHTRTFFFCPNGVFFVCFFSFPLVIRMPHCLQPLIPQGPFLRASYFISL